MELTPETNAAGPVAGDRSAVRPRASRCGRGGGGLSPAPPAAFFLLFLLLVAGGAAACPSCKEGLSSPENPAASAKLTKGWARSIYLLMWTPYLLFGGAAFAIVRSARRKK